MALEITPPFSTVSEDGTVSGLAVDLANELVTSVDSRLETILCPWARCMRLVEQGNADFIVGVVKTKERQEHLLFIEPAFIQSTAEFSFYQLSESQFVINKYSDLTKLTIGIQRGASHFQQFDQDNALIKVEVVDITTMVNLLLKKRIDLFLMPKIAAKQYIQSMGLESQIHPAPFSNVVDKSGYIALSKKSQFTHLTKRLNIAFAQLKKSGRIEEILARYNVQQ